MTRDKIIKSMVGEVLEEEITDWQEIGWRILNMYPSYWKNKSMTEDQKDDEVNRMISEITTILDEKHNYYL